MRVNHGEATEHKPVYGRSGAKARLLLLLLLLFPLLLLFGLHAHLVAGRRMRHLIRARGMRLQLCEERILHKFLNLINQVLN